jgi:ATP-dependent Clp protease, protease subunit
MKKEFVISAESVNNRAVIRIEGYISNWNDNAANFKAALDNLIANGVTEGDVYIRTQGGDCFEANEIANAITGFPGKLTGHLGALCASAGTYIASKLPTVKGPKNLAYMIHKPMGDMNGNSEEIKAYLKALENLEADYLATYAEKTGMTEARIAELWKQDYWMNAVEAKDLGFIDEIEGEEAVTAEDISNITALGYKNIPSITATVTTTNEEIKTKIMKEKLILILASIPGCSITASSGDNEIIAMFDALKIKALKADELQAKLDKSIKDANDAKIEAVLNEGEAKKKFTPVQRGFYKASLESNFDVAKEHIDSLPAAVSLSATATGSNPSGAANADRSGWDYEKWVDNDPVGLSEKAKNDPEGFEALFNAYYSKK